MKRIYQVHFVFTSCERVKYTGSATYRFIVDVTLGQTFPKCTQA